jgi:hypothetical protein
MLLVEVVHVRRDHRPVHDRLLDAHDVEVLPALGFQIEQCIATSPIAAPHVLHEHGFMIGGHEYVGLRPVLDNLVGDQPSEMLVACVSVAYGTLHKGRLRHHVRRDRAGGLGESQPPAGGPSTLRHAYSCIAPL